MWGQTSYTSNIVADALHQFLSLSQVDTTRDFYECYLSKSLPTLGLTPKPDEIITFRGNLNCSPGGKHAYHRALRAFYNWLYSPASGFGFRPEDNPIRFIKPPKVQKGKMPAQTEQSVMTLLSHVDNPRDRAIIATLIDSSGRLTEVSNICEPDILWDKSVIKAIAKGGQEVYMPFSPATGNLLREWLAEYHPNGGSIWDIKAAGIVSMLRRLEKSTGIKCNAHTFRRGFASILRRKGVDSLDIKDLGHWKSMRMVERYTESVIFEDSQKHYKAPTEQLADATYGRCKDDEVPRPRIELGTRGFSVRQQYLLIEILTYLTALGQVAEQLRQALGSNGHHQDQVAELIQQLAKGGEHAP